MSEILDCFLGCLLTGSFILFFCINLLSGAVAVEDDLETKTGATGGCSNSEGYSGTLKEDDPELKNFIKLINKRYLYYVLDYINSIKPKFKYLVSHCTTTSGSTR